MISFRMRVKIWCGNLWNDYVNMLVYNTYVTKNKKIESYSAKQVSTNPRLDM